jgi:hypothetical protein
MENSLFSSFKNPGREYSPVAFWFLNDQLEHQTLVDQMTDFMEKGVYAVCLHPRMGMPKSLKYLSEEYFGYIGTCLRFARENGMKVFLYDEGMYPSGSAGGLVAKRNPEFAGRGLYETGYESLTRQEKLNLAAVYAVSGEAFRLINENDEVSANEQKMAYVCGYSNAHIRGVYEEAEWGREEAPLAGDILGREAVAAFIDLTHQQYYDRFGEYFGATVIGMFTDEPAVFGRDNPEKLENPMIAWTPEMNAEGLSLPALFRDFGKVTEEMKKQHHHRVRELLSVNFYGQIGEWCARHGLVLTGHPAESGDIDFQKHFGLPGQDLVWRMVEPGNNLDSPDSVLAKCASDAARHRGIARNMNEAMGCCGPPDNLWAFTADEMFWYLNWLFVRGTNMMMIHAFYYSVRSRLQYDERPPDLGPNNIWWRNYKKIADYIARLSWLNTGGVNAPYAAVLCAGNIMPYKKVKALYENGIDFNYLDMDAQGCTAADGRMEVCGYQYRILLLDDSVYISPAVRKTLDTFTASGGLLYTGDDWLAFIRSRVTPRESFFPHNPHVRITRIVKDGTDFYLLANECDTSAASGVFTTDIIGKAYELNLFTGDIEPAACVVKDGKLDFNLFIEPCRCMLIAINTALPAAEYCPPVYKTAETVYLDALNISAFGSAEPLTAQAAFRRGSGDKYTFCFDELHGMCALEVDGSAGEDIMFRPYTADITPLLDKNADEHTLKITVYPSPANRFGSPVPVGISGARVVGLHTHLLH